MNSNFARTAGISCALFAMASAGMASDARAAINSASSQGYGLEVGVHLLSNSVGINVGPTSYSSGNAPAAYSDSDFTASVFASAAGVASLSTGVLTSSAMSDVDAGDVSGMAMGQSQVDGLSLRVVPGVLPILDLINLGADTIGSNASVSHNGTSFGFSGGMLIEDATLRVLGVGNIAIDANAAPNTVLLDLLGIKIILNEQIEDIVGNTATMTVNAIHISITGTAQIVGADIIIGHSSAMMTVPAPASATMIAGLAGFAGARRRR